MVCLALKLIGSWVLVGFSVGMDVLDGLFLVKISCSQEFSGVLRSWAYVSCLWISVLFFQ